MSKEAVSRFFELVATDPDLREAVRAAVIQGPGAADALVALGAKHQCTFTVEEFNQAASGFFQQIAGEMNGAPLDDAL